MDPAAVISTILKHDQKVTSYKLALLRAINDVALSFPDIIPSQADVAVPLRVLARFWVAYYWPFVDRDVPILQGRRADRGGRLTNDMEFRPQLEGFRAAWQTEWQELSSPSDGFFAINELLVPRRRLAHSSNLLEWYDRAVRAIAKATRMPICHAGPGEWMVFERTAPFAQLAGRSFRYPLQREARRLAGQRRVLSEQRRQPVGPTQEIGCIRSTGITGGV